MTTQPVPAPTLVPTRDSSAPESRIAVVWRTERNFIAFIGVMLISLGFIAPHAELARWVGFVLAGYSAVANDSVQTLGTFIASNKGKPWWMLWLFIGGIFVATVGYSFMVNSGDVTYGRLASKGFESTPMNFTYLQLAAPVALLVLTRARMPVSTTFLLLSCFATEPASIGKVLMKSLAGYGVAFGSAIIAFLLVSKAVEKFQERGPAHPAWRVAQWGTTGLLWSVWLMQDASNIAVYLPRQLSWLEFGAFATVIFLGLGLLFKLGGARVQHVIDAKSRVTDVRAATVVDLIYAVVLYIFKIQSGVPMSTTWVFIGLLAGREIGMAIRGVSGGDKRHVARLIGKDLFYVTIGLLVSLAFAICANPEAFADLLG